MPEADALLFHPDFLHRTPLAQKIRQYSFFSYASNEALHLSADERVIIQDYMGMIAHELEHPIDRFSKPLIVSNIEVLLNYCMRFYERQFITREELNNDVLVRFERLLDEYWESGMAERYGLPTVKYFADKICLSPNYFGDLVKAETGKTARDCYGTRGSIKTSSAAGNLAARISLTYFSVSSLMSLSSSAG